MPGKPDYDQTGKPGQYYPGSKEYRAWDEGWVRRYVDGGGSQSNTVHPVGSAEYVADQAGWTEANGQLADSRRRMPYIYGSPP